MNADNATQIFIDKFHKRYIGIMQWDDFEGFWQGLKNQTQDWFLYDTNTPPPRKISENIKQTLDNIHKIIKEEHQERYCGLIFTDDLKTPTLVKIFHPNNLGKSCGSSEYPALPRWILSKIPPIDIIKEFGTPPEPKNLLKRIFK